MSQRWADALLVAIAMIWGTTFTVVHEAVRSYPALALIALRFWLAAVVFLPFLFWRQYRLDRRGILVGGLLGGLLFSGFATQTLGLQHTTPARAGFITGLNVVLVPVLGLAFGMRPARRALAGVLLAVGGLALLSWGCFLPWLGCQVTATASGARLWGDLLVLACAFAFAMHIVAVSRWGTSLPVLSLNALQMLVVAILATIGALLGRQPLLPPTPVVWQAAAFLGLVATALVFALQLKLQRYTTATHTALIFALEPVFAALFSWWWTGEVITTAVWLGGGLMLLGVIVAELPLEERRARRIALPETVALDGEV
ncbi:DMT family transporter [Kallotenue papyrolyticum]|uniref:DMT family transporter n=1 Tax=Kallotenue papyrolyticum TaxID=1325125 RepID=UPI0004785793|nr:DMT family transporter [Kallotenue papyrolyticum]